MSLVSEGSLEDIYTPFNTETVEVNAEATKLYFFSSVVFTQRLLYEV